MRQQFSINFR